jgi:murein L,D-transpeptidase YcbB/YkuD
LARYRAIAARGGWPQIPADVLLRRGVRDTQVAALRRRLLASGDLLSESDGEGLLFDAGVERAVKTFQQRHGLAENGLVDEPTRKAMNVAASQRLRQLLIAMERWRWLPRHLGRRYLLVNVPGYTLYAMDTERKGFSMRVIIGKAYRQTPSVRTQLTEIIVNPYWYVPKTILREDILPRVRRDPGYLRRSDIRVLSSLGNGGREVDPEQVDWQRLDADNFPYILRQQPGARNVLGRIKFRLADSNGIYLHDTPDNTLFERRIRAYSSGCIRLEDPLKLAEFVLQDAVGWNRGAVEKLIAEGAPRRIALPEPLPVLLVYWTAWVGDDGLLQFRDDIYGRDRLLEQALLRDDGRRSSS